MKMPLKWLRDYVEFDISAEELEERLILSGTAIEGVEKLGSGAEQVFAGQIDAINPHPNADRLVICDVNLGERTEEISGKSELKIVCGATNMKPGDKIPVALLGARLPNGLVLEGRKIRGVASEGMLCSETELGLSESSEGLMILDPAASLGETIDSVLGVEDTVLELEITPNRPDCMSMIGMAREVGALVGAATRVPVIELAEGDEPVEALANIEVHDPERCPRYIARIIRGVKVGPSPQWMVERLVAAGMRSINNIVDVTNFVMLETGQPLHAFDYHRLTGGKIVVRRASSGEEITTLDGQRRFLSAEDLVIADAGKAVALAGVMGSEPAEVHDDTVDILLESAYFKPENVMATARGIGLMTESSARFERGTDPNGVAYACDRAAALMAELAGGVVSRGRVDHYPEPAAPKQITLRTGRCRDIIGAGITDEEMAAYLRSIDIEVDAKPPLLIATVPTFRRDLDREIDLIEEVARLYGYNRIQATMPRHATSAGGYSTRQLLQQRLRDTLIGSGLFEALTNTLVPERDYRNLIIDEDEAAVSPYLDLVSLKNPLSEEYAKLRSSLIPGLLRVVQRNLNWGASGVSMFEIGGVFQSTRVEGDGEDPYQGSRLALVMWGDTKDRDWHGDGRPFDIFDLKGALEVVFERILGRPLEVSTRAHPLLHPGSSFALQEFGWAGQLHPAIPGRFDIDGAVYAAEIDLDAMLSSQTARSSYRPLPRYPAVRVDLSMLVDESRSAAEVTALICGAAGKLLDSIDLFDLYQGDQVPAGKKSLAFNLAYRSDERTLTDDEVAKLQQRVIKKLTHFGIEVRTGS